MKRSNTFSYSLAVIVLLLMAAGADAQVAHSKLVWLEGEPCIEAQVAVDAPQDVKEITVATSLFDKDGKNTWNGGGKIQLAPDKPAVVQIKLQGIANKDEQHRVTVRINQPALELDYSASFTFAAETGAIQWHGVIVQGSYPNERDVLAIQMNPVKDKNVQGLDLNLSIRDTDENVVSEKVEKLAVGEAAAYFEFDVTPGRESVGPYSLEYRIESDALAINFSATEKFAHANVLLPVTSFELDDTTWMTSDPTWAYGNVALGNSDRVTYDAQQVHSGKQSLRIDFNQGRQVGISSKQVLPGLAMKARIWVKGSGSQDVLHVRWRDHCDMTRAPWNWFPNESQETVCRLDFDDWRCFTVPVLGAGLQVKSPNGSTNAIDAPIYISSFTITPGRPNKDEQPGAPRTIWIDDIFAETQLSPDQQAAMEVRADTIDHLLHPQAKAFVAIGNGKNAPITGGKIRLVAKGRGDQTPVLEMMESLDVPAEGFAVKEFSLADLAAKSPMGPVDVDVSFVAPAAGIRRAERIVFKNPKSMGLFWDFEKPAAYNHFAYNRRPGWKPSSTVPGGAEGSAMALRLEVECPPPGPQHSIYNLPPEDALLLHPAMPGEVDRIEVMIKGGPAPVELRAVLIDSGLTGVTPKMYNMFWSDPVKVDWQDWRKVEFPAPAVPAWYGDRFKYFDDKPFYPLNLAFIARMIDEKPSEVFFDNIRVKTHLLPEDELLAWVDFPDDTHIRKPGSPLQIVLTNFASAEKKLSLSFELRSFQDIVQQQGKVDVAIPPGRKVVQNLVQSLPPGIFTLTVDGIGSGPFREYIQVLDATQYFGQDPPAFLKDVELAPGKWIFPPELRKTLGMTVEKVYLDWDNTEPEPGLFLPNWFNVVANEASANGSYQIQPVVGFGADWAGPHAQESIAAGEYSRFIGNYLQVPVSLNDWSNFTREIAREFKGRFPKIEFWENPDLEGGPQSLPPEKYADMLKILHKWLAL
ncbi:MAG TPA: hypothetical protein VM223_05955, partial [Planctomycetota bacterium]|nr:hypothetical protein [Planctomycetota bacterium]